MWEKFPTTFLVLCLFECISCAFLIREPIASQNLQKGGKMLDVFANTVDPPQCLPIASQSTNYY